MKNTLLIIIGIILFCAGFFTHRATTKTETTYEASKTVVDTFTNLVPYAVEVPKYYALPTRIDTIRLTNDSIVIHERVDTSRIIAEYVTKNMYKKLLFDSDTIGRLEIGAEIQYNKLQSFNYLFTPRVKIINPETRRLKPFVAISTSSLKTFSMGGGVFYRSWGLELKGVTDFDRNGVEVGILKQW